jgi:hypothetical protein
VGNVSVTIIIIFKKFKSQELDYYLKNTDSAAIEKSDEKKIAYLSITIMNPRRSD